MGRLTRWTRTVVCAAAVWSVASVASAALYQLEVTGVLTRSATQDPAQQWVFDTYIPTGSTASFSALIDTSVTASGPCTPQGGYTYPAMSQMVLTVGNLVWTGSGPGHVEVDTLSCSASYPPVDNLTLFVLSGMSIQTPTGLLGFDMMPIWQIYLPVFGAPAAPLGMMPEPFSGTVGAFAISWGIGGSAAGELHSSITPVPAPAISLAMLVAIGGALTRRRRR